MGALPYNAEQRNPMHIAEMDIRNTPPFTELVELDFDKQVNLFIGPNASGKSALLREIDAAFNEDGRPSSSYNWHGGMWHKERPFVLEGDSRKEYRGWDWNAEKNVLLFTSKDWTYDTSKPPMVYAGPVRTGLPRTLR